jgi:hypothetical protein
MHDRIPSHSSRVHRVRPTRRGFCKSGGDESAGTQVAQFPRGLAEHSNKRKGCSVMVCFTDTIFLLKGRGREVAGAAAV